MNPSTPLEGIEVLLADLDGVIYRGPSAIEYAVESINGLPSTIRVGYLTNNASRTDAAVAAHLVSLGLHVIPSDVVTSPQAAVRLLEGLVPTGSSILVVGGDGLTTEVTAAGYVVTRSALDSPAAVIQGFAPEIGWTDLAEAAFALQGEGVHIPWIATNTDWTIPQARGTAPGNGTLVSAVHTAIGRLPIVAGKPELAIFQEAIRRFGSDCALMLGDRLDTDILGANRAGLRSAFVLTGIDKAKQLLAAALQERPTFILQDLRDLAAEYPEAIETVHDTVTETRVGQAVVLREGGVLRVAASGTGIDLLRAGCAAIWNSGMAIYAMDVPSELYS